MDESKIIFKMRSIASFRADFGKVPSGKQRECWESRSLRKAQFGIGVGTGAAGQAIAAMAEDRAVALVGIEGSKDEGVVPAIEKTERSGRSVEDDLVFVGDQLVRGGGPFAGLGMEGDGGGMKSGEAGRGEDGTGWLAREAEGRNEGRKESGEREDCEEQKGIKDKAPRHVNWTAEG